MEITLYDPKVETYMFSDGYLMMVEKILVKVSEHESTLSYIGIDKYANRWVADADEAITFFLDRQSGTIIQGTIDSILSSYSKEERPEIIDELKDYDIKSVVMADGSTLSLDDFYKQFLASIE